MEQEIVWRCNRRSIYECSSADHVEAEFFYSERQMLAGLRGEGWKEGIQRDWVNLIEGYTTKSLTCPSDIFPALQGLAKLVPKDVMGRYLAGLWETTLTSGLC
jgi:hypothetical protein